MTICITNNWKILLLSLPSHISIITTNVKNSSNILSESFVICHNKYISCCFSRWYKEVSKTLKNMGIEEWSSETTCLESIYCVEQLAISIRAGHYSFNFFSLCKHHLKMLLKILSFLNRVLFLIIFQSI